MAGWRERSLLLAALWLPAGGVMAGSSLPAAQADNARSAARSGFVQPPGQDAAATLAALQDAVRDDALRAWPGVKRAQLQLQTEAVTWPDGALGCPQDGQTVTQALVPGWRLVVRGTGSMQAVYHASQRGQWLQCAAGSAAPAQAGGVTR